VGRDTLNGLHDAHICDKMFEKSRIVEDALSSCPGNWMDMQCATEAGLTTASVPKPLLRSLRVFWTVYDRPSATKPPLTELTRADAGL
jgi:hypothetical protein